MLQRLSRILLPVLVVAGTAAGAYVYFARRAAEKGKVSLAPRVSGEEAAARLPDQQKRVEKALKAMDRARQAQQGQIAARKPVVPPNVNPTADIQRTLRTIEEINRINRMNRENKQPPAPALPPKQ